MEQQLDLRPLMAPSSIGVLGASERKSSRGARILGNLAAGGFQGPVIPINPKYEEIDGLTCYPSAAAAPPIDTLVACIPAAGIPDQLAAAFEAGTKAAVVLASGFLEAGAEGRRRHDALRELAAAGMVICGPNCYGVLNVSTGAASFSGRLPDPMRTGPIAVVSQSGGFSNLIANPLVDDRGLGVKYIVSCGNQAGAKIEDFLAYLVDDPDVRTIACFVEALTSPERLLEIGAAAERTGKTIVMLKGGRSAVGSLGVASHTGAIAGSAQVVSAWLRKAGIIEVSSLDDLVETTALLAHAPRTQYSNRVFILTGSGGESSHVADLAEELAVDLPEPTPQTTSTLQDILPDFGSARNPLDGTGAMFEDPTVFPRSLEALVANPSTDVCAVNISQLVRNETHASPMRRFSEAIAALPEASRRQVIAYSSTTSGSIDRGLMELLAEAGVPMVLGTQNMLAALTRVNGRNDRALGSMPPAGPTPSWPESLDPFSVWDFLTGAGLPLVAQAAAPTAEAAVAWAGSAGYPVTLKIASARIAHKSDIGGVILDITDSDQLRDAHSAISSILKDVPDPDATIAIQRMAPSGVELLAGMIKDPALGPAVVLGSGGLLVEILEDSVVGIPPFTDDDVDDMVDRLRIAKVLAGVRGNAPADLAALRHFVRTLGDLALSAPDHVRAIDLNPVIVHPAGDGLSAVDVWLEVEP